MRQTGDSHAHLSLILNKLGLNARAQIAALMVSSNQ
jgi:hypothetical protein